MQYNRFKKVDKLVIGYWRKCANISNKNRLVKTF